MRIQTYRDQTFSRHFDLIGGVLHPWSIDLVSLAASSLLAACRTELFSRVATSGL